MHMDNPYESRHISESMHPQWNWRISILEDSDTLMNDLSGREDAASEVEYGFLDFMNDHVNFNCTYTS